MMDFLSPRFVRKKTKIENSKIDEYTYMYLLPDDIDAELFGGDSI